MNKLQEQRLKQLNSLLMEQTRKMRAAANLRDPSEQSPQSDAGSSLAAGAEFGGGAVGGGILLRGFIGWFKSNPKKALELIKKSGMDPKLIAQFEKEIAKDLSKPSVMRRLMRLAKKPFVEIMKKPGSISRKIISGIGDFFSSAVTQQKYFGVGSKYIVDPKLGTVIKKMNPAQIFAAAKGKMAQEGSQKAAQIAGKKAIKKAEKQAVQAVLKNNAKKAGQKAAETAIKLATEKGISSPKVLDSFSRKAAQKAEERVLKKGLTAAAKKSAKEVGKEAIEFAGKKASENALQKIGIGATEQLTTAGGKKLTGKAAQDVLKRVGTKGFGIAASKVGVGAALGAAGSLLTAAQTGLAIGALINNLTSENFGEELAEIISEANTNESYAIAEMDAYCFGKGSLCNSKTIGCKGQRSGYEYGATASDAGAIETSMIGFGSGLPKDAGRDKTFFTRKWEKSKTGRWHAKDGATMLGLMAALMNHDIEAGRITVETPAEKYTLKKDALVKKYKNCFLSVVGSPIVLRRIVSAGLGDGFKAVSSLFAETKDIKLPDVSLGATWKDKPYTAARVAATAELFYQALEGVGTDQEKLIKALGMLRNYGPTFTLTVEKYFSTGKYSNWDSGGLRDAIADDLYGSEEDKALAYFISADKIIAARNKKGKPGASPTPEPTPDGKKGPIKCDGYPITKNCIGKPVENLIVIAVGGTETGPTIVADTTNKFNRDTIDKLIDDQTLNQEVIDLITLILQKEEAFKVLKAWKQNKYTIKSGDVVDRWFDVTASRKGMTENLDFYRKLKKNKYNKLTNLLMERIK